MGLGAWLHHLAGALTRGFKVGLSYPNPKPLQSLPQTVFSPSTHKPVPQGMGNDHGAASLRLLPARRLPWEGRRCRGRECIVNA